MPQHRIGLIVPSSNTTMETEVPELLHRHGVASGERFTFHSSRARLHTVDPESLHRMVGEGTRCARELGDARVHVVGYACLIALMAEGPRAHERIEPVLAEVAATAEDPTPIVSSAGALVRTLLDLGLQRVAIVTPYLPALTQLVFGYLAAYDIEVVDSVSLGVADNHRVGELDPGGLPGHVNRLDLRRADGLVLSACVQMPSLPSVQTVEDSVGLPVVTAATATARELLAAVGLPAAVPGAGAALAQPMSKPLPSR
ncbi:maleate cis-trans isomerase family protein [Pseudonocardia spinosispora]|uniref:maleate cis-trans isomerase family protein n=1 Tax=Pseudonocardia spinosispora TaxID=103441 RepID=UPI00041A1B9B|nr:Asp/Glu racemase [Pseudonocardia spinosispora]